MAVSLPAHIGDPLKKRVRLTSLGTAIAKENNELFGPALYGRLINYLPPLAALPAFSAGWRAGMRTTGSSTSRSPMWQDRRKRGHFGGAPIPPRSLLPVH